MRRSVRTCWLASRRMPPTERLAAEGAATSVGSRGDTSDNSMAEPIIGLYKGGLIAMRGPSRAVDDVELATLSWVHETEPPQDSGGSVRLVSNFGACGRHCGPSCHCRSNSKGKMPVS